MKNENKWLGDQSKRKTRVHLRTTEEAKSIYQDADVPYHIGFEYYAYEVLLNEAKGETILKQKIKDAISIKRMLDIQIESIIETGKDLSISLTEDTYEDWLIKQEIASILHDFEIDRRFSKIEDFVLSRYEKNRCVADTLNLSFEEFRDLIVSTYEANNTQNLDDYVEKTPSEIFEADLRILKKNIRKKLEDAHLDLNFEEALDISQKRIENLASLGVKTEDEILDLLKKEFKAK